MKSFIESQQQKLTHEQKTVKLVRNENLNKDLRPDLFKQLQLNCVDVRYKHIFAL